MKAFHVAEAIKHRDYQLQNCGLYIDHKKNILQHRLTDFTCAYVMDLPSLKSSALLKSEIKL